MRRTQNQNHEPGDCWPEPGHSGVEPPSSVEVDYTEPEPLILYGPDGDVLTTIRRRFGFAAWRR